MKLQKPFYFIVMMFLLVVSNDAFSKANTINAVRIWDSPDVTSVVLDSKKKADYAIFKLSNPNRIVVDLNQTKFKGKIPYIKRGHPLLKNLRSAEQKNESRRFVIDAKGKIQYRTYTLPPNDNYGHRLVIEITKPSKAQKTKPVDHIKSIPIQAKRGRDVIVAIDAGHGGEDPGAIGRYGTQEKKIALRIAKKLKRRIDNTKGMRAVLVRKGDYYISLRKRMDIAREAKADMFISIHADAFNNPRVKGSSVYVLSERGASDEASKWLADKENSSDLIGGVSLDDKDQTLAMVLLDLSQTATIDASTRVASNVLSEIRQVGPVHKKKVQNARFVVLKSPDIPSLLVETAFISNPQEEKRLNNARYQNKLAKAILKGVKAYFKSTPPPGTWLAKQVKGARQNQAILPASIANR